ncbi:hypothetical protein D3C73_1436920 [compost metagenome]
MHEGGHNADLLLHAFGHFADGRSGIELQALDQSVPLGGILHALHRGHEIEKACAGHAVDKVNLSRQIPGQLLHRSLPLPGV